MCSPNVVVVNLTFFFCVRIFFSFDCISLPYFFWVVEKLYEMQMDGETSRLIHAFSATFSLQSTRKSLNNFSSSRIISLKLTNISRAGEKILKLSPGQIYWTSRRRAIGQRHEKSKLNIESTFRWEKNCNFSDACDFFVRKMLRINKFWLDANWWMQFVNKQKYLLAMIQARI